MTAPQVCTIDFETDATAQRPAYPPEPCGVSIKWPGEPSRYFAWSHPTANNCTREDGVAALRRVWESGLPILCHNAKFDAAVAYERLGFPRLPWERVHDTMFLLFLVEPHSMTLALKPAAAKHLNMPPDEQNEVHEWLWARRATLEQAYRAKVKKSELGAWISKAPGDIVGRYACGDTDRTAALFAKLWPVVQENGMGAAYDRERQLLPILMENEERGIRVDLERLGEETARYEEVLAQVEDWLRKDLRASGLNLDADRDVASVLLERGIVPKENWSLTKSGQLSVAKDALKPQHFTGPNGAQIASALGYRNRLVTCLKMFMQPWLAQASARGGIISTSWNQVRGDKGGTRTGRTSTRDPNISNISKDFEGRSDGYLHPDFLDVPNLPLVRKFVLPDEGGVFCHRDFDGQELRIFAHFESGALKSEYAANPSLDPHRWVQGKVRDIAGREIERTRIKNINFGRIYGGGVPRIQEIMGCSRNEAKELADVHSAAFPGMKHVNDAIRIVTAQGKPITTFGGRLYFPEERRLDKKTGRMLDFGYKLINYLVQGSAADYTKQCIIEWYSHPDRDPSDRFLCTVYDEINMNAPAERAREAMRVLREVMEQPRIDIPMLTTPKYGPNWGALTKGEPPC